MKKRGRGIWSCISLLLCAALLLGGCSGKRAAEEARALSDLRKSYRSADLVALCECAGKSKGLCALKVSEVLAGKLDAPAISCFSDAMEPKSAYLVYLAYAEGAYAPISIAAWDESKDEVLFDDILLSMEDIRADMAAQSAIISAPAEVWFYRRAQEVFQAADEIFIGRVETLPALSEMSFRAVSSNATVAHSLPAAFARVRVLGSVKGALSHNDTIELLHAPAFAADLVDATTLKAVSYGEGDVPQLSEGGCYVFFLLAGPDPKQSCFFCVNPMQGYIGLEEDALSVAPANTAFASCTTLTALLEALREEA